MSNPQSNPRRKAFKTPLPPFSTTNHSGSEAHRHHGLSLRKAQTFQVSTPPSSEDVDPVLNIPSLPRRSATSLKSLEDVIAGEQRMAVLLNDFERGLSGLGSSSATTSKAEGREQDLSVPKTFLDAHVPASDPMSIDVASDAQKKVTRHQHTSDSGIGTSISSSSAMHANTRKEVLRGSSHSGLTGSAKSSSPVTRSVSSIKDSVDLNQRGLGFSACKRIERLILAPILRVKRLEPFHSLVKGIPEKIVNKEITCLRDLEKTLIFLAPVSEVPRIDAENYAHHLFNSLKKYSSAKASSYINFCEVSIQCIHTTVGYLNDREQRRPTDRPYTNGYFLDLVEQIRQYASMMAASRQRSASGRATTGKTSDEFALEADEELVLEGGLSNTGRPAELVRKTNGKKISLRTGAPYEETAAQPPTIKRSLSTDSADDSVMRSMARRKKDAPPLNINKKCSNCDKVFRRPCDLTKHEKTHTRPWKCSDSTCKYAKKGWPTEKERDRHVNDKHSKAPPLFKCHFDSCPYQSKRESNCKQHMEKAHGWTYVRSKNTGKNSKKGSAQPTPDTVNINTPVSSNTDLATPSSGIVSSPYTNPGTFGNAPVNPYAESSAGPSAAGPSGDFQLYPEPPLFENNTTPAFDGFNAFPSMDFNAFQANLQASDPNEYVSSFDMRHPSIDSSTGTSHNQMPASHIPGDALAGTSGNTDLGIDWGELENGLDNGFFDNDFTALHMQQLMTPATSVDAQALNSFSRNPSISGLSPPEQKQESSSFSPGGQANVMLYSPNPSPLDEGFHDSYEHTEKQSQDYTLFENSAHRASENLMSMHMNDAGSSSVMFPPMPDYQDDHQFGGGGAGWPDAGQDMNHMNINMNVDDYMHMDEL